MPETDSILYPTMVYSHSLYSASFSLELSDDYTFFANNSFGGSNFEKQVTAVWTRDNRSPTSRCDILVHWAAEANGTKLLELDYTDYI